MLRSQPRSNITMAADKGQPYVGEQHHSVCFKPNKRGNFSPTMGLTWIISPQVLRDQISLYDESRELVS